MFSFTPPTRAESSWIDRLRLEYLNMTRFWQCSPVATLIGATLLRIAACPSTSSGLVGSSIQ